MFRLSLHVTDLLREVAMMQLRALSWRVRVVSWAWHVSHSWTGWHSLSEVVGRN